MGGSLRDEPLDLAGYGVTFTALRKAIALEVPPRKLVAHPLHHGHSPLIQHLADKGVSSGVVAIRDNKGRVAE